MLVKAYMGIALTGAVALLTACSNGGNLTLEPNAVVSKKKGAPFAQVNQGGRALIIEKDKTATTGVHGWVAVQSVASQAVTDTSGHKIITNKTSATQ